MIATRKSQAIAEYKTFDGLPELCFSVNSVTREIVMLRRGMSGYHPYDQQWAIGKAHQFGVTPDQYGEADENGMVKLGPVAESDYASAVANVLNREIYDVTRGQREAMEIGSLFGWDNLGSDPARYSDDGKRFTEVTA